MRRLLLFALTLLLAVPAAALVLDSGDGQGNTTPPADDPGWAYVGRVTTPSGIYLGNGWMLTANHVTVSDPEIEGMIYPVVPDSLTDWPADPGCASELDNSELADQDGDGVIDPNDNCVEVANTDQRDSNLDGYGNLCDTDYDGDGVVGLADYGIFRLAFGKTIPDPAYNPDVDAVGDGGIGLFDFGLFQLSLGRAPGPSGLACAGSPPCP